jgi:STE24 endopeptidase
MGRSRLPLAVVVAVAAAAVATFLLRPRSGLIDPAPVEIQHYFTTQELDRAEDFRGLQRVLGLAGLGIGIGTLAVLAWRPPRGMLRRLERRPLLGGGAAAAGISLLLVVTGLPVRAWMRERSLDVGLATQSWPDWASDVAKSTGIGAVTAAIGGIVAVALIRRFPRHWWAPGAVLVVAYGVVTIWLYPIVIDPVFNDFERLPDGRLRSEVLELADRAGVDVGEVYRVDASRRTTAANAYVIGLGHTKRVVIYDNLIDEFSPDAVQGVVAHELGHVHYNDVPHGLLYLLIVTPFGMLAVARLGETMMRRGATSPVPAVALAIALIVPVTTMISNQLSRQVEARADRFSIELTGDPDGLIEFQRKITVQNVSDPDPPGWVSFLLGTHPTAVQRIGQALALSEDRQGR